MIKVEAHLAVYGELFSPRLLDANTAPSWLECNEPGEVGISGRYQGKPRPYGSAELSLFECSSQLVAGDVSQLLLTAARCREAGGTDLIVWLGVAGALPMHLELDINLMRQLGAAGLPIALSYYPTSPILSEDELHGATLSEGPVPGVSISLAMSGARQSLELMQSMALLAKHQTLMSGSLFGDTNRPNQLESASLLLPPQWPLGVDVATIRAMSTLARQADVTLIEMHARAEFETQCNLELSAEFLGELAACGVPFSLSCDQVKARTPAGFENQPRRIGL